MDTYNYNTLSRKYTLCSEGCIWTPTTTVRCQANTPYAAQGACGHLQLQYVVKQILLMQRRVHVNSYNYSTLSSKYILYSAGACGHLQLQYFVKQIHLMQRWCMWTPTTTVRCQAYTPHAARVHVDTYNYSTLSSKYTLCCTGCMWTHTITVRCQANTPHATQVHVDTYNYSTLSSKYTSCSAGCSTWTSFIYTLGTCSLQTPQPVHVLSTCLHLRAKKLLWSIY